MTRQMFETRSRSKADFQVREAGESAEMRISIDRLRGRSIHCSSLAQHAHSSKIAAEFERLAQDYEDDAVYLETQMRRRRRTTS